MHLSNNYNQIFSHQHTEYLKQQERSNIEDIFLYSFIASDHNSAFNQELDIFLPYKQNINQYFKIDCFINLSELHRSTLSLLHLSFYANKLQYAQAFFNKEAALNIQMLDLSTTLDNALFLLDSGADLNVKRTNQQINIPPLANDASAFNINYSCIFPIESDDLPKEPPSYNQIINSS